MRHPIGHTLLSFFLSFILLQATANAQAGSYYYVSNKYVTAKVHKVSGIVTIYTTERG